MKKVGRYLREAVIMTIKVDVISGFLGAGKTTMIKKLLDEDILGEGIAIIENEFGDINIDADRLKKSGIEIRSISYGCICCTLSGDFHMALKKLIREYNPKRIIIEPTGVGRLSDIISIVNMIKRSENVELNMTMTIVDTVEFEDYIEVFGDFFTDQIQHANIITLSKSQLVDKVSVNKVIDSIRKINPKANIIATPWDELEAKYIIDIPNLNDDYSHHHDHEENSGSESFEFCSFETMKTYSKENLELILSSLNNPSYGKVLRAKGALLNTDRKWVDFDFVLKGFNVIEGKVKTIGQVTVIGKELNKETIRNLFD
jgi:G3E family GTPase